MNFDKNHALNYNESLTHSHSYMHGFEYVPQNELNMSTQCTMCFQWKVKGQKVSLTTPITLYA